jgi:hypothetical protein
MANLSQTPGSVALGTTKATVAVGKAGEAITQGMPIYKSSSDDKWYQCDANVSATVVAATAIALTAASADGYFVYQTGKDQYVNLGATLTVGETYVVSRTKGAICPIGDLISGDYPWVLGVAYSASLLKTIYAGAGVAKP